MCFVFVREQTATCATYTHKLIGFYSRDEKCLQRGTAGSLNKAVCGSSLKPTGYVMYQQFNIQQLYALPTLYLCVLYLSENKQRLVPLTV